MLSLLLLGALLFMHIGQGVVFVVARGAALKENRSMLIHIGSLGALFMEKYGSNLYTAAGAPQLTNNVCTHWKRCLEGK